MHLIEIVELICIDNDVAGLEPSISTTLLAHAFKSSTLEISANVADTLKFIKIINFKFLLLYKVLKYHYWASDW